MNDVEEGCVAKRKQLPKAIAGTPDAPLVVNGIKIPCYVLENETRVLSQGGFLQAIGRSRTPKAGTGAGGVDRIPTFLASGNLKSFMPNDLEVSTTRPIGFIIGGRTAYGYPAELLPVVCEVYLEARDAGALLPGQVHIAQRAEILIRGLARVGIIALVDEATGYQVVRERRALAAILERYLADDHRRWTKTFPYTFYSEIFRLKGWPGPEGVKRPSVIGHYTNDFVYARLAPGILDELRARNPVQDSGGRRVKHHQWFTPDAGHPRLREHISAVIAIMKTCYSWESFKRRLNMAFPRIGENFEMQLPEDDNGP